MSARPSFLVAVAGAMSTAAALAFACGDSRNASFTDAGTERAPGFGTDAIPPCEGLRCRQVACADGKTTRLSGKVYAPTPTSQFGQPDPLYNVIVYVPNAPLDPFPEGVSCERCGAITSGSPIVTTLTRADGSFVLEEVPAGADVPLVMQVGRWRRQIVVPNVTACEDNPLDRQQTRLPRTSAEGDIPRIAIVTSPYDATECLLRKIGIADSEFTRPDGPGRVHLYQGAGGASIPDDGAPDAAAPNGEALWDWPAMLARYDVVALPCSEQPAGDTGRNNIVDYADRGGRVFVTDLSRDVIKDAPPPWPSTATWDDPGQFHNPASIDTTFPKGAALADWLVSVGATKTRAEIPLEMTFSRVRAPLGRSQRWVYSAESLQTYSFNTPVGAPRDEQCGRVFFSSFHVTSIPGMPEGPGVFPKSCTDEPLSPQEKLLEFLLFDLAACVIRDDATPAPPVVH